MSLYMSATNAAGNDDLAVEGFNSSQVFKQLRTILSDKLVEKVGAVFQFTINGPNNKKESWIVDLKTKPGSLKLVKEGQTNATPDIIFTLADDIFVKLMTGKLQGEKAFMSGQIRMKGPMDLAMNLMPLAKELASLSKL